MSDIKSQLPFIDGIQTPNNISKDDIDHVRQWIAQMPHLPTMNDDFIRMFLNANQSKLEKTKSTIENFFTIRTNTPEVFANRDPMDSKIQHTFSSVLFGTPKARTPEGYTVVYGRLGEQGINQFDLIQKLKLLFMFMDMTVSEDGLSPGYVFILDSSGFTLSHLATFTISIMKMFGNYNQFASPVKMIAAHLVNTVPFIDTCLNVVKPFVARELLDLVQFHKKPEALLNIFPPEVVPRDYGGKCDDTSVMADKSRKLMETKYRQFLQDYASIQVDERLRQGSIQGGQQLFGAEGSFRSLNLD